MYILQGISKKNVIILLSIGILAIIVSFIFNTYYNSVTGEILNIAVQDIHSNAEIEVNDLSIILENKVDSIMDITEIISNAPSIQNNNTIAARTLINKAKNVTDDIVDFYMWLDAEGKMVWLSNINNSAFQRFSGVDLSYRDYFTIPKERGNLFLSSVVDSNDGIPRIYISYPITAKNNSHLGFDGTIITTDTTSTNSKFKGTITAAIRVSTLGNFLQGIIPAKYNGSVGLIGKDTTILFTSNRSLIGKSVFAEEFQSILPNEVKQSFNQFLNNSLYSGVDTAGIQDIYYNNSGASIAYHPIFFNSQLQKDHFGTLYLSIQHNLANNVLNLFEHQRLFSFIVYVVIGLIAVGIALLFLLWNKRLVRLVNTKTKELTIANNDLMKANEKLKNHDKMQKEFINVAAHELRTPTQAISGYSQLAMADPDYRQFDIQKGGMMDTIKRNADRLKKLTEDILNVTRIESNSLSLNRQIFNINEKIEKVIDGFDKPLISDKRIRYVFNKSQDPLLVNADKTKIFEVLSNLLSNSIKFVDKEEGKITISVELDENNNYNTSENNRSSIIVSVQDNGKGIDSSIMPRLFTKFAAKSFQGTGLGLYISKKIVEAHSGKMWAENNKDGKGATFSFSLPLHQDNEHIENQE